MARNKSITIRDALTRRIPDFRIRQLAAQYGVVQRKRKIDIVVFVWTLILGFAAGTERTLAGLRRTYEKTLGIHISASAFYDRFTRELVDMLKALVADFIDDLVPPQPSRDRICAAFLDVLVADSTVIKLHDLLKKAYAACRTNHTKAAAKLHMIINARGRGLWRIRITSERMHDGPVLKAGPWVRGKLLLFDLGYYRFQLFDRIARQGGYFVTRLKEGANPIITAVHLCGTQALVGQHLQEVLGHLRRPILDFEVEVQFRRRSYQDRRSSARARFRLVGIYNELTKRYHLYLTNIPVETVTAQQIAALYSIRWTVELLFRELKHCYRIEQLPSSKRHVVEALLYASILTLAVSRRLFTLVAMRMKHLKDRMPMERWAIVFHVAAWDILLILVGPRCIRRFFWQRIFPFLCYEAIDPNVGRKLLLQRVHDSFAEMEAA
jgi:putative transposase